MTMFFGYKPLKQANDWAGLAGEGKWVKGRSSYELAHAWQSAAGLPSDIGLALDRKGDTRISRLELDVCLVEKPVFLDTRAAPSMTDLMAYGRNGAGEPVVMAVEGKADEVFASRIWSWVRGDAKNTTRETPTRPTRIRRLEFLAMHLGIEIGLDSELRYQLLHRTVSAIVEAQLHGAVAAIVLVHAFGPDVPANWQDFVDFLGRFHGANATKGEVAGPFMLGESGDLPTYFLWWQQPVTDQSP